jgi:hypothetical protein
VRSTSTGLEKRKKLQKEFGCGVPAAGADDLPVVSHVTVVLDET